MQLGSKQSKNHQAGNSLILKLSHLVVGVKISIAAQEKIIHLVV